MRHSVTSIAQLRPESRGHLHINSGDARDQPAILANYLDSQTDRDVLLRGMHMMRRISSQNAFAKILAREYVPGPDAISDEDLMAFARQAGTTTSVGAPWNNRRLEAGDYE